MQGDRIHVDDVDVGAFADLNHAAVGQPEHGWTWDLAGTLKRVPNRKEYPSLWEDDWPDQGLVQALQSPTDYVAVFEYGLSALLATLPG